MRATAKTCPRDKKEKRVYVLTFVKIIFPFSYRDHTTSAQLKTLYPNGSPKTPRPRRNIIYVCYGSARQVRDNADDSQDVSARSSDKIIRLRFFLVFHTRVHSHVAENNRTGLLASLNLEDRAIPWAVRIPKH